jgi:hypothetical protein
MKAICNAGFEYPIHMDADISNTLILYNCEDGIGGRSQLDEARVQEIAESIIRACPEDATVTMYLEAEGQWFEISNK